VSVPEIIAHSSSLSVLVPLVFYLLRFRRLNRPGHIIGILLFVAGICDLAGYMMFQAQHSTAVVFNIYYTVMFLLLCRFYYEILFKDKFRIAMVVGIAVYVLSFVLITFYVQNFFFYQNLVWIIAGVIMILYSVTYFLNSLSAIPSLHLFDNSTTWINTGVLFYFSFSLFLFSMGDYLFNKQDPQVTLLLWSTHNVNNIIKNILFAIGFTMYGKPKIKTSRTSEIILEGVSSN
jgi:hypothetical protein